jgi:SAM-dependent methyltransferase
LTRVHPVAAAGFASAADVYERARPSYPPEAIDWLVAQTELGPGRTVVDVGAGTGKLTRLLLPTQARVLAVEPIAEMRSHIAGAEVLDGTAEAIPLPDGSADVVTVAQAFHWFDAEAALREIERVLRPGGLLALVSNRRDPSVFDEVLAHHRAHPPLEPPPVGEAFPHVHRANFAELASTESSIATLEGTAYDAAIAAFSALGSGEIRYVTYVQITPAQESSSSRRAAPAPSPPPRP